MSSAMGESFEGWSCPTCTFFNAHGSFLSCEICGESKPPSSAAKQYDAEPWWESEVQILAREREEKIERERQALIQERMKEIMLMQQELWAEKEAEDRQRRESMAMEEEKQRIRMEEEKERIRMEEEKEQIRREEEELLEQQARVELHKQELELRRQEEKLREQQARLQRQREELERRNRDSLTNSAKALIQPTAALEPSSPLIRSGITNSAKAPTQPTAAPEPSSPLIRPGIIVVPRPLQCHSGSTVLPAPPQSRPGATAVPGPSIRDPGPTAVAGHGALGADEAQSKSRRLEQERRQLENQSEPGPPLRRPGATAVTGPGTSGADEARNKIEKLEQERRQLAHQSEPGPPLRRPGATAVVGPGTSGADEAQNKIEKLEQERRQLEHQSELGPPLRRPGATAVPGPGAASYSGIPPDRELEKLERERRLLEQQQQQCAEPRPGAFAVSGVNSFSSHDGTADRKLQKLEQERQQLEVQRSKQQNQETPKNWQEKWLLEGQKNLVNEHEQDPKIRPGAITSEPMPSSLMQMREEAKALGGGNTKTLASAISSTISQGDRATQLRLIMEAQRSISQGDRATQLRLIMEAQRQAQQLSVHEPSHVVSTQSPPPARMSAASMESQHPVPAHIQLPTSDAVIRSPHKSLPKPSESAGVDYSQNSSPTSRNDISPNGRDAMRAAAKQSPPAGGKSKEDRHSNPGKVEEISRPIRNRCRSEGAQAWVNPYPYMAEPATTQRRGCLMSGLGGRRTSFFGRKKLQKQSSPNDSEEEDIHMPPTNLASAFETTHRNEGDPTQEGGQLGSGEFSTGPRSSMSPMTAQQRKSIVRTKRLARDPKIQSVADLTIVSMDQLMDDDNPLWEKSARKGPR